MRRILLLLLAGDVAFTVVNGRFTPKRQKGKNWRSGEELRVSRDPMIGTELGGHRLVAVIGRGGMGIVYRAESDSDGPIAVKIIAPELSRSTEFRSRFLREAEAALDHPHIVPIYGAGEEDGHLFMKMLLVDGLDLKKLIAVDGRLTQIRAVTLLAQAAEALDFAHASLLVHRDIKPQNLLVQSPGELDHVFLTDFGLVKRVSSQSSFTSSGHIVGSSPYMAPEQIKGSGVDGRSDVYSLGCVLYECLTGLPPFRREEEVSVLWAHVNEPPPRPSEHVGVLGDAVDAIVAKAMAKDPDDRYLTAGDLAAALAAEAGVSKVKARSPWISGKISPQKRTESSHPAPATAPARSWWSSGVAASIALVMVSGLAIAGPLGGGGEGSLLEQHAAFEISEPDAIEPSQLPDLVASDEKRNRKVRFPLIDTGGFSDGSSGAAGRESLPSTPLPARINSAVLESIVPDNSAMARSRIVFTSNRRYSVSERNPDYPPMDLYVMQADGTRLETLSPRDENSAEWLPTLSTCGHLTSIREEDRGLGHRWLRIFGPSTRVAYGPIRWRYTLAVDWSPDCRRLAYTSTNNADFGLNVMDPDGSNRRRIYPDGAAPQFSPDGKKIAFHQRTAYNSDIFVIDSHGSTQAGLATKLTAAPSRTYLEHPVWSPDAKKIAYTKYVQAAATGGEATELWVMDADGSNQQKLLGGAVQFKATSWTPDGQFIVFYTNKNTASFNYPRGDINIIRPDGTGEKDLIPDNGGDEGWLDWQPPSYRIVSAKVAGGALTGRVSAVLAPCERAQPVGIQRYENGAWRYLGSVTTSANGRFEAPLPGPGRYRAHLPLSGAGALLCGIDDSPGRET